MDNTATPTPTPDPLDTGREIVTVSVGEGVFAAVVADTSETRATGLSGREALGPGRAMWFDLGVERSARFWMKDMRFPIDIAFLDENGRVLYIHHELKPKRLSRLVWRAEGALELAAGTLRTTGTEVGDVIEFEDLLPR